MCGNDKKCVGGFERRQTHCQEHAVGDHDNERVRYKKKGEEARRKVNKLTAGED